MRFSYNDPVKLPIEVVQKNFVGIAGFSETDSGFCDYSEMLSRTLAVFYRPYQASPTPAYHFATYD